MRTLIKPLINRILCGDANSILKQIPSDSIDAIVTDPPYGLAFMAKLWDSFTPKTARSGREPGRHRDFKSKPGDLRIRPHRKSNHRVPGEDYQQWCQSWAHEVFRVLKPGGHLLAFGGSRTYHRLVCGIETAGFEIRDSIHWVYANGFPKSLDISKAIDKAAGARRQVIARRPHTSKAGTARFRQAECAEYIYSLPATEAAKAWQGWGTGLKPAHEAICLARKPLLEPTVVTNVLKHGTGGLNLDGCRIELTDQSEERRLGRPGSWSAKPSATQVYRSNFVGRDVKGSPLGRWPSNFVLSHNEPNEHGRGACRYVGSRRVRNAAGSIHHGRPRKNQVFGRDQRPRGDWRAYGDGAGFEEVPQYHCMENCPVAELDRQSGYSRTTRIEKPSHGVASTWGGTFQTNRGARGHSDRGYGSRFFKIIESHPPFVYQAKPPTSERNLGCEHLFWRRDPKRPSGFAPISHKAWERLGRKENRLSREAGKIVSLRAQGNIHCTVKGVSLLEYLIRLVTPPGGVVLDPFAGSGTTGVAAARGGWRYVLIEQEPDYVRIAKARLRQARSAETFTRHL